MFKDEVKGAGIKFLEISIVQRGVQALGRASVFYYTALCSLSRASVLERLLVYLLQFNNEEVGDRVIKIP